jgi:[1-hydroxy-2-(trimethylamino)ethyl]phosphonate dioxygenase
MLSIDEIFALYERLGSKLYGGERVSQLEHAIQTAMLAERAGAGADLIVACLLHDYGHLLPDSSDESSVGTRDDFHEVVGADQLSRVFGEAVTMPIRLHVEAKRYLCGADRRYLESLSPASIRSLELQGGALDPGACSAFLQRRFAADAVKLRRFDDAAKVAGLSIPDLEYFRPHIESSLSG